MLCLKFAVFQKVSSDSEGFKLFCYIFVYLEVVKRYSYKIQKEKKSNTGERLGFIQVTNTNLCITFLLESHRY